MKMNSVIGLVVVTSLVGAFPAEKEMKPELQKGIVSQEISKENESNENKKKELFNMMERQVFENTGLIQPPQEIPPGVSIPKMPFRPPDKNWGRKMNEKQWQQKHARLNPKRQEVNSRVMHNRNTINDNRHDRKSMKIPRHAN